MKYFAIVCFVGVSGIISTGFAGTPPSPTPSGRPGSSAPAPAPSGSASTVRCGFDGAPPCALITVNVTAPAPKPTPMGPTLLPGSSAPYSPIIGTSSQALNPMSPYSKYYNDPAFHPLSPQIIDTFTNPCANPQDYVAGKRKNKTCIFSKVKDPRVIPALISPANSYEITKLQALISKTLAAMNAESTSTFTGIGNALSGASKMNLAEFLMNYEKLNKLRNIQALQRGWIGIVVLGATLLSDSCAGASWIVEEYSCRENNGRGAIYHSGKRRPGLAYSDSETCGANLCNLESDDVELNPGIVAPLILL